MHGSCDGVHVKVRDCVCPGNLVALRKAFKGRHVRLLYFAPHLLSALFFKDNMRTVK